MADEKYIELINQELSGTITPQQREDLHEYLRKSPDARNLYRELLQTSDLLSDVRDVEPPAYLKNLIMNSVDFSRYRARQGRPVLTFLTRVRQIGLRPRFAYVFALGVVVGLVVYSQFLTRPAGRYPPDVRDLYGTIGVARDANFETIECLPIDLPQMDGTVTLSRFADVLVFDFGLHGSGPSEILLEYEPDQVTFGGLRPGDPASLLLETGSRYIRASASDDLAFGLSFVKAPESPASFDLGLIVSGKILHSHRFVIADLSDRDR